jgi:hypothetical protein
MFILFFAIVGMIAITLFVFLMFVAMVLIGIPVRLFQIHRDAKEDQKPPHETDVEPDEEVIPTYLKTRHHKIENGGE